MKKIGEIKNNTDKVNRIIEKQRKSLNSTKVPSLKLPKIESKTIEDITVGGEEEQISKTISKENKLTTRDNKRALRSMLVESHTTERAKKIPLQQLIQEIFSHDTENQKKTSIKRLLADKNQVKSKGLVDAKINPNIKVKFTESKFLPVLRTEKSNSPPIRLKNPYQGLGTSKNIHSMSHKVL